MQQPDSVILYGYLGEAVAYDTVAGFLEAFGEELVVTVVVAKHADKVAIEFLEVGYGEGGTVVACVEN